MNENFMERKMSEDNCKCHNIKENCEHPKDHKCCKQETENTSENDNTNVIEIDQAEELNKLKDALLRKVAEMENLRKRFEKEKEDTAKYANSRFAKDLLPVLDNFEKVSQGTDILKEADQTVKAFFDGVALCEKELLNVFKKHGIEKIEITKGEVFDPNYHQVMLEIPDKDSKPGAIINVLQNGYICHGRVLRASLVSVAKKDDSK